MPKERAPLNRTLTVSGQEYELYKKKLVTLKTHAGFEDIVNTTILADITAAAELMPSCCVDLLIADPPYNLSKNFSGLQFSEKQDEEYFQYTETWLLKVLPLLKQTASVYICCDWKSSPVIYAVMKKHLKIRNRITWQREKGRGAKNNWKNGMEDIWFATMSNDYYFDVEAVKMKRRVLAPYRNSGVPKDWEDSGSGKFRLTCPSNFWDDISIPYWSMPENTDHPTQKPEKLLAKLILASSQPGAHVFDPFLGSGSTSVAAKKLGRTYTGVEVNEDYCIWAEKRLALAVHSPEIQGYAGGVFWERNTAGAQLAARQNLCPENPSPS